jgi:hypothetical protein
MRKLPISAIVVAGMMLGSCGGGPSLDGYFLTMNDAMRDTNAGLNQAIGSLSGALSGSTEDLLAGIDAYNTQVVITLQQTRDAIGAIEVPGGAEEASAVYEEAIQEMLTAMDNSAPGSDTMSIDTGVQDEQDACDALQDIAGTNDVTIDLACHDTPNLSTS